MTEESKTCPQCGGEMSFRLGMYDCPQCGYSEERPAGAAGPGRPQADGGPREAWHHPSPSRRGYDAPTMALKAGDRSSTLYSGGISSAEDLPYDEDDRRPSRGREKVYLLGFFLGKGLFNILIAVTLIGGRDWGVVGSSLLSQLIGIGLMALVLYVPIGFIKYIVGFCSCAYALLILASLILSAVLTPLLGLLLPFAAGVGLQLLGVLGWVLSLADVLGYLWLASLLFRDLEGF